LIYDEKLIVIELFWHAWHGQPHWRMLQLEILPRVDAIAGYIGDALGHVSPSYWTTWPCLVLACFRSLLDHVSCPSCSTCQVFIGTRVVLRLEHMSLLNWTMCHIFIGPCGNNIPRVLFFLLGHVSRCCTSSCQFFSGPHVMP
jgi:hypothetical protein